MVAAQLAVAHLAVAHLVVAHPAAGHRVAAQLVRQVLRRRVQEAEQQRPEERLACAGRPLPQHPSIPCRTLLLLPRPLQLVLALELLRVLSPRRQRE